MFPSPCSTTTQDLLLTLNNRRLLLHSPLYYAAAPPTSNHTATTPDDYTTPANGFDANVIMVLSVLLCALFCSLGLNSIVRCALTCSTFLTRNSNNHNNNNGNNRDINSAALEGGVKKRALKTFPTVSFSVDLNLPGLDSECVICLSEFEAGERVRLLPKCNHGFHVRCIDRWLDAHSSCPTCRSCLIDTCHKIVGPCNDVIQASSSDPSPIQPREIVVNVTPLEHEDMIHTSSSTNN